MTSEPSSPYDHELPAGQEPEVPHRSSDQRLRFSPAKTIAAFIVALACLVTAGAAVTMAVHSDRQAQRSDERVAELVDAIEYGGDSSVDPSTSNAARSSSKKTDKKKTSATPKGGDKAKAADTVRGGNKAKAADSAKGQHKAQNAKAAEGAAYRGGSNNHGNNNNHDGKKSDNHHNEAPAAEDKSIPEPTADELLHSVLAASDDSLSSSERYFYATDGAAAGPTLDEVARIRASAAPPAGAEDVIGGLSYEVSDIVTKGDTATAKITLVFPGGWGKWDYPNSEFKYVDGTWKLQKSSVCNLAKAAWIGCY